jgi:multicomponent Na+:H+ antiporter subunit C
MRADDYMSYINGETIGIVLFFTGLYGLIARRNIVKTIISLGIMETAIVLFFVSVDYQPGSVPPIGKLEGITAADPLPQALMITAIVIGVSVTAVALTMFITLYHNYGTTNWEKIVRKRIEQKDD